MSPSSPFPFQKNENQSVLIFSGFIGCTSVCPRMFQDIKEIGRMIPQESLKIIFLNIDALANPEEFEKNCLKIFQGRVECFFPNISNSQNFFREIGLPIFRVGKGFEHSGKFLLIRAHEQNALLLFTKEDVLKAISL
jgi:cytochrome oxidase Cu insertion factor (SCO1/SenC/PrrC family)